MHQDEFLRAAQNHLGMTPAEFAAALGVNPRTLRNWLYPSRTADGEENKQFRNMPEEYRVRVFDLLRTRQRKPALERGLALLEACRRHDFVTLDWDLVEKLAEQFVRTETARLAAAEKKKTS